MSSIPPLAFFPLYVKLLRLIYAKAHSSGSFILLYGILPYKESRCIYVSMCICVCVHVCNDSVVVGHVLPLFLPSLGALPGTHEREHGWTPAREEENS